MSKTIWCASGFPKVGIRPVIDGRRRGVRESLEEQTMNMAKSAAKLISASLKYPDGSPVQCVIADTNIGGCAEASACAAKFERDGHQIVGGCAHDMFPDAGCAGEDQMVEGQF